MDVDFTRVSVDASKRLREQADSIAGIKPIRTITEFISCAGFSRDSATSLSTEIQKALRDDKHSIYVFSLGQGMLSDNVVLPAYCAAKESKAGGRAFARVNKNINGSRILYIGSSTNTPNRIKEHFGLGHEHTYSMHFLQWVNKLDGKINLSIYVFGSEHKEKLHLIEEYMWEEYKPLLGRSGSV